MSKDRSTSTRGLLKNVDGDESSQQQQQQQMSLKLKKVIFLKIFLQ